MEWIRSDDLRTLYSRCGVCPSCLQMQEFGSRYEAETLKSSKKLDLADAIVYVHDSSDTNSFSYISNLRVRAVFLLALSTHFVTAT